MERPGIGEVLLEPTCEILGTAAVMELNSKASMGVLQL